MSGRDGSGTGADETATGTPLARREVLKGLAGVGGVAGGLTRAGRTLASGGGRPGRYVVGIDPGSETAPAAHSQARSAALTLHREVDLGDVRQVVAGWYAPEERERLREHPAVAYVEPEAYFEPHRPALAGPESTGHGGYPWGIERIGADTVHDDGYTGDGADVVVIDTGADPGHPSLADNVGTGSAFGDADCVESERGYSSVACQQPWDDDVHHGTHVAGTVAAVDRGIDDDGNPSVEVDRIVGVAPDATVHVANVFEWVENGSEWVPLAPASNVADAIRWAADQEYDVANASLGGPTATSVIRDALAYAVGQHDVVFVASAGNAGRNCGRDPYTDDPDDCVSYPAAFGDAIAVGNVDADEAVDATSARGPGVDVAAPGTGVLSAVPPHLKRESSTVDSDHWWLSGTSMAAPHVAGLAALLKAHTDLQSPEEICSRLRDTAEDIGARDVESGAGLIDAVSALDGPGESLSVSTLEPSSIGPTSATVTGELTELGAADTATVAFEYWPGDAEQRQETAAQTTSEPGTVETRLTDLVQDTAYAFRALADTGSESDAGATVTFSTPIEEVSRPTVDRTPAGDATFSQWGDGYRIRAAGKSPFQRPRDEHGYGAIYGEAEGDNVIQTTLAGLRGDHDLRIAGLVVTNDILGGGGIRGDLILAVEPAAGVSLVTYDEDRREYETVASGGVPFEAPVDLRVTERDGRFLAEYRRATGADWQAVGSVAVSAATATRHAGLFATAGHESSRCVADFTDFRIGETGVVLLPSARVIPPDVETTLDLVVENAENGIRSYTATIDVPDTDLLTIEEVALSGDPVHQSVDILPDGSRATIRAGMEGNAHDAGDVRIAEVTVHTGAVGTVPVALPEVVVVDDAAAVPYDIAAVEGSELTVAEGIGPPPVVGDDPPRDVDGDGLYRDVDGDGEFTISDVQVFFQHRRDDVVLDNAQYFNFADRDPPDVSIADVQALFRDLVARDPDAAAALGLDITGPDGVDDLTAADLQQILA